jgi:hypothetical protein
LVTGGSGLDVVEDLINKTKAGVYCRNGMEIRGQLLRWYLEYKEKGRINNSSTDVDEINKYNYKNAAKKFSEILDNLIKETRSLQSCLSTGTLKKM